MQQAAYKHSCGAALNLMADEFCWVKGLLWLLSACNGGQLKHCWPQQLSLTDLQSAPKDCQALQDCSKHVRSQQRISIALVQLHCSCHLPHQSSIPTISGHEHWHLYSHASLHHKIPMQIDVPRIGQSLLPCKPHDDWTPDISSGILYC